MRTDALTKSITMLGEHILNSDAVEVYVHVGRFSVHKDSPGVELYACPKENGGWDACAQHVASGTSGEIFTDSYWFFNDLVDRGWVAEIEMRGLA